MYQHVAEARLVLNFKNEGHGLKPTMVLVVGKKVFKKERERV